MSMVATRGAQPGIHRKCFPPVSMLSRSRPEATPSRQVSLDTRPATLAQEARGNDTRGNRSGVICDRGRTGGTPMTIEELVAKLEQLQSSYGT